MHIHADLVSTWNQIHVHISGLKCQIRIKSFEHIHKTPLVKCKQITNVGCGSRLSTTAAELELPILVETQPFYIRQWDGRESGVKCWVESTPIFFAPWCGRKLWANAIKQNGVIQKSKLCNRIDSVENT